MSENAARVSVRDADVGDPARGKLAQANREAIRVVGVGQVAHAMPQLRWDRSLDHGLALRTPKRIRVEHARRHSVLLLETAREVGTRREAAREGDLREARPRAMRQQMHRALEARPLDERRQGLAGERPEDAVKVEGRERGCARDILEEKGFREVPHDVVDRAIDAGDVVGIRKIWQVRASGLDGSLSVHEPATHIPRNVLCQPRGERLPASRAFYEKLGFSSIGGNGKNWLILRNGSATIGLFQGMFEKNILTFNPGWDENSGAVAEFTDVREHQRRLKAAGHRVSDPGGREHRPDLRVS
jgi:hypothetical protein